MLLDYLFVREMAMGTMEKTDMASVITPIISPPVRRVTQQQQRWKQGILGVLSAHCTGVRWTGVGCPRRQPGCQLPAAGLGWKAAHIQPSESGGDMTTLQCIHFPGLVVCLNQLSKHTMDPRKYQAYEYKTIR